MDKNIIIAAAIALIIGGAGGFFGGLTYQKSKASRTAGQFANFRGGNLPSGAIRGNFGSAGRNGGFRPVNGEILSVDANGITVKLVDGSSKVILISDKTAIEKTSAASKTDLTVGKKVNVFGTEDSSGIVTAQNVQINLATPSSNSNSTPQ